jgi:hypothetical protein
VETKKNPSKNKSRVPHFEKKKKTRGIISNGWNDVERLFACLKYTRNFISFRVSCTHHDYGTQMGKCTMSKTQTKN